VRGRTPDESRVERWLGRVLARATTPRGASVVIASTTTSITLGAGILMTVVDRNNFPSIGSGLWWADEARHTYASLPIAAGINTKAISTYMGHASITITLDCYGHLMPGNEKEAE
jgi:hypothetical protein